MVMSMVRKIMILKAFLSIEDNNQYNGMINYNPKTLGKLFKEEEPKNKWKPDEIIKKNI